MMSATSVNEKSINATLMLVRTPEINLKLLLLNPPHTNTSARINTSVGINPQAPQDFSVTLEAQLDGTSQENAQEKVFDLACKVVGFWHTGNNLSDVPKEVLTKQAVRCALRELYPILRDRVRTIMAMNETLVSGMPWSLPIESTLESMTAQVMAQSNR